MLGWGWGPVWARGGETAGPESVVGEVRSGEGAECLLVAVLGPVRRVAATRT